MSHSPEVRFDFDFEMALYECSLVGEPLANFAYGFKPTRRQVLRNFFYTHSSLQTSANIHTFYFFHRWDCIDQFNINKRFEKELLQPFRNFIRSQFKPNQPRSCFEFLAGLDEDFDVSFRTSVEQRKRVANKKLRNQQQSRRVEKEKARQVEDSKLVHLQFDSAGEIEEATYYSRDDLCFIVKSLLKEEFPDDPTDPDYSVENLVDTKINILTESLCATMDRTTISDRSAFRLVISVLKELGFEPGQFVLSVSSINKYRSENRNSFVENLRAQLDFPKFMVLHWDGVRIWDQFSKKFVEHLAIKVTGRDFDQLLSIERSDASTAEVIAEKLIGQIEYWDILDKISFLNCDTPNTNTGVHKGVHVQLEQMISRKFHIEKLFIRFNCRHHEAELQLRAVFLACFGKPMGPRYPFLDAYQSLFDRIDLDEFNCYQGEAISEEERLNLILFIEEQLARHTERNDKRELLDLSKAFLMRSEFVPVKPARYNISRWMKPFSIVLQMYLFRDQLKRFGDKKSQKFDFDQIERCCIFGVKVYLRHWFSCSIAPHAPADDLRLFKAVYDYDDDQIATECVQMFNRHSSYLQTDLIGLSFFDERIPTETFQKMIDNLTNEDESFELSSRTEIEHLVSKSASEFFEISNLPRSFLQLQTVEQWLTCPDYQECAKIVRSLTVVNDTCERTLAVCKEFANHLSKDNSNISEVVHVVSNDRQLFGKPTKSAYM